MSRWEFPPFDPPEVFFDRVDRLDAAENRIHNQHVVSKVVLKGFAAPSTNGYALLPYDLKRRHQMKPRGLRGCGKVTDFLPYASESAEALWHSIENDLDAATKAARNGALHQNASHVETIRKGIALHLVRSQRYMEMHSRAMEKSLAEVADRAIEQRGDLIAREFTRTHGLLPAGREALESVLDKPIERWRKLQESGAMARVSVESMFHRVCTGFEGVEVEVWHTPPGVELLISDSPCLTIQYADGGNTVRANLAIGDSHTVTLPIAADCLVSLGPEAKDGELLPNQVSLFNRIQVDSGYKHVYYRPGSGLGTFVSDTLEQRASR